MANTFVTPLWVKRDGVRAVLEGHGLLSPELREIIERADEAKIDRFAAAIARAVFDDDVDDDDG